MSIISDGARRLPVHHITIRVPWHDSGWKGTVCRQPLDNSSCLVLRGIGENRRDEVEERYAGRRLDELNASIGRALTGLASGRAAERLALIQNDLFVLGSHVARSDRLSGSGRARLPALPASRPGEMEAWIDESQAELPPLRAFIVPGGSPGAGELHLTRAVCRRAERRVVALGDAGAGAAFAVRYLNRLSDLLFALARRENQASGAGDVLWRDTSG